MISMGIINDHKILMVNSIETKNIYDTIWGLL